jgi:hypothetical protein
MPAYSGRMLSGNSRMFSGINGAYFLRFASLDGVASALVQSMRTWFAIPRYFRAGWSNVTGDHPGGLLLAS